MTDNRLARDLAAQTEQDDPAMVIVRRADVEEVIALVREITEYDPELLTDGPSGPVECFWCSAMSHAALKHKPDCARSRAEALLARWEAVCDE